MVIGILSLLLVMGVSFLLLMRLQEKEAANFLFSVKAKNTAKSGIEEAIIRLKADKNGYDAQTETWHSDFAGDEVDLDGDGVPDSKWINILKKGKLVGRYSVLVKDEEGKLNINEAGNLSKGFYTKEQGTNEGWKPNEIKLTALPGIDKELSRAIVEHKYGKDKKPGKKGFDDNKNNGQLSKDGIDNDGDWVPDNEQRLKGRHNGRPNPGERDCDEDDEGEDEPDEFCFLSPLGDDQPFITIEDLKGIKGIGEKKFKSLKNIITTYSYDKNINSEAELRMNINTESIERIKSALRKGGITDSDICNQIAVNIIDYRDRDDFPTSYFDPVTQKNYYGIEETPYINEVEASPVIQPPPSKIPNALFMLDGGEYIELFNPYPFDIPIGGWTITASSASNSFWASFLKLSFFPVTIPPETVIPANGYYTIGDILAIVIILQEVPFFPFIIPLPIPWPIKPTPDGCDLYLPLSIPDFGADLRLMDSLFHTIEISNYGQDFSTPLSKEKNDPRARSWSLGLNTPGKQNSIFSTSLLFGKEINLVNWPSSFEVKNYPFATVGELGDVHKGQQWETINFWRGEDIAIADQFTTAEAVGEPIRGKININTAPKEVLTGLPGISEELAEKIISARPFKTIGEILGEYSGEEENPKKALNKAMIAPGKDFRDNDNDGFVDEDDEKEEVFRKISNLITVRSNLFSIISFAQFIRDKNGNGKVEDEEILAEKKIRVIYDRGSSPRKVRFYKEGE